MVNQIKKEEYEMIKIHKEPNIPEGYECISTYYSLDDRLQMYDADHFVRCECNNCFESFWVKKKFIKKLKSCPFCRKSTED